MTEKICLSQKALQLLFEVIEATETAVISGLTRRQYAPELEELRGAGLAIQEGRAAVGADDEDRPRELIWSPEMSRYGYFSEDDGWVAVDDLSLECFAIDIGRTLGILTSEFRLPRSLGPRVIIPNLLWEAGSVRFGGRPKRNPVLFARRLGEVLACQSVEKAIKRSGFTERVVLLTTTASDHPVPVLTGCEVVSVRDVLRSGEGLAIDPAAVAARLSGRPPRSSKDLELIADGKEVRFFGQTFVFKKGLKQRKIICFLHERLEEGQYWVSSAEIVVELDFTEKTRIRDLFKGNPAWGKLLTEKDGMCGFCFVSQDS